MKSIYELTKEDFLKEYGTLAKPFHYDCLRDWLKKGTSSFENMTTLPAPLIKRLKEDYKAPLRTTVLKESKEEDSTKLLLSLHDGEKIECVLLKNEDGEYTACLSSEVGCSMKCEFCATGTLGLKRQLNYTEIIEQFFNLKALNGRIDRVVFMGMGEPLANTDDVVKAIEFFKSELEFSARRVTISTSGIANEIKKLSKMKLGVKLAVSLVSANDTLRSSLMKTNRLYPLSVLKEALVEWGKYNRSRIALEYCMLSGVNTSKKSAKELKDFTAGLCTSVNLIPWNTLDNLPFKTPTKTEIKQFQNELKFLGVSFTTRVSRGQSTNAACGMLALKLH